MKDCGAGRYRNPTTNRCKKVSTKKPKKTTSCGAGKEKNPNTGRCRKSCTSTQIRNKQGKCVKHTVRRHKSPKRSSSSPAQPKSYVVKFEKSFEDHSGVDDDINNMLYEFYTDIGDQLNMDADAMLDQYGEGRDEMYESKKYFKLTIDPINDGTQNQKYNKANIVNTIKRFQAENEYSVIYRSIK